MKLKKPSKVFDELKHRSFQGGVFFICFLFDIFQFALKRDDIL